MRMYTDVRLTMLCLLPQCPLCRLAIDGTVDMRQRHMAVQLSKLNYTSSDQGSR